MDDSILTADEFVDQYDWENSSLDIPEVLKSFARMHVTKIRELQEAKYVSGETGYIKSSEWDDLLDEII
jgi:hypothetical protein